MPSSRAQFHRLALTVCLALVTAFSAHGQASVGVQKFGTYDGFPDTVDVGSLGMNLKIPQTLNRYAYVANNPLSKIDPKGLYIVDCTWDGCGLAQGTYVDGVQQTIFNTSGLGGNGQVACPNNVCNGFTKSGEYFQFVAGAGGASGYVKFSDITQGINEWNGTFYSNAQFQSQVIDPAVDRQRWALAKAIAAVNGQDPLDVYLQLKYEKTAGGNSDFKPGSTDLSFLNSDFSLTDPNSLNHQGEFPSIHLHASDGLIHLDTANPLAWPPIGALGHLFFDLILGNINGNVPMTH